MKQFLESMKKDFADGSLLRVRPSANPIMIPKTVSQKTMEPEKKDEEPIYLYFEAKSDESSTSDDEEAREAFGSINNDARSRAKSAGHDSLRDASFKTTNDDTKLI